ncbi:MAG: methylated-DNA--[protein]-cysteine S-methyltransferase [Desulfosalsimonadaceae bacterium]
MKTTRAGEFFFPFESPVGTITLLFADDPFVLTGVVLPRQGGAIVPPAGRAESRPPEEGSSARILQFFQSYFNKRPASVPWDLLRLDGFTPLERLVWKKTTDIAFGTLSAYSAIAEAIGRPGAARFVGNALGKNPFPIIIPCHRVIRKDGGLGGFGSGIPIKTKLVAFEG